MVIVKTGSDGVVVVVSPGQQRTAAHVADGWIGRSVEDQVVIQAALGAWDEHVGQSPDVTMALGRLSVLPGDFLNQVVLYTFTRAPAASGELPALSNLGLEELSRVLFRGSVDSDYGKRLRWETEAHLLTHLAKRFYRGISF